VYENEAVKRLFLDSITNLDDFYRNLFLLKGKSLKKRSAVIILDGIQFFPPARQAIKLLVKDGRYDFIETGSLISIRKSSMDILIPSEEHRLAMYPMDFEEFLWARGDTVTASAIRDAFISKKPFDDAVHRKIMQTFRTYMAAGGMPQAVDAFCEGQAYEEIDYVKRSILDLYEEDLKKYDKESKGKAHAMFKTIPQQLSHHNSLFHFSDVGSDERYAGNEVAVDFLEESSIGNLVVNVTDPQVALELFAYKSNFKLFLNDTGLLVTQSMKNKKKTDDDLYKALIFDHTNINQGMIWENMVAQTLRSLGYDLYFHTFKYHKEGNTKEQNYEIVFSSSGMDDCVP